MHDPMVLLFDVPLVKLDVWHVEPAGHDFAEVCGHPPYRRPVARTVWALRHARHLRLNWWPYLNVRRWIVDRCDHCGRRFRWREAQHSYQSTDKVWHDPCMSLRHVRGQLDDLTGFVLGTADSDARWRADYRLKQLESAGLPEEDRTGA
jgi:hypothetical protein